MDTGLDPFLEAVLVAHPGVMIGRNPETEHWEAIRKPTTTCVILDHAATLAGLLVKLGGA